MPYKTSAREAKGDRWPQTRAESSETVDFCQASAK
jgi:hypothetical protein